MIKAQPFGWQLLDALLKGLAANIVLSLWIALNLQSHADDPLELLANCHAALGENESDAGLRLERRNGEWNLIAIDLSNSRHNVDLKPFESFSAIETLQIQLRRDRGIEPTVVGIAAIEKLRKLRELVVNAEYLANGIDLENTKFDSIESLRLGGDPAATGLVLTRLSAFPRLKTLAIYPSVTDESFANIRKSQSIQSITIWTTKLTDSALTEIATLQDLRLLDISSNNHVTEVGIQKLLPLRKLSELAFLEVNDKMTAALAALPALETLTCMFEGEQGDLRGLQRVCSWKTSDEFLQVSNPPVRILLPSRIFRISCSDEHIPMFDDAQVPQVQVVQVFSNFTRENSALSWIRNLPNLRHLTIQTASGADVEEITALENLQSLALTGPCCRYSDDGFVKLKGLKQLKTLESESGLVTEKGLVVLENFQKLERLSINALESSIAGLEPILKLKKLRSIHLRLSGQLRDDLSDVFKKLANLENLEEISIPGRVTDEGLKHLTSLPKLRRLDLSGNTGYTDAGLARLMTEMPSLQEVIK